MAIPLPIVARWPHEARALWERLRAHGFDAPAAALPFSRRLARDNGWSTAFAERAVEEYRRFVFLAVVAGHPVTPSDAVDQVWHLHLLYTRDYWQVFCADVLRSELHHGPTAGGGEQRRRFDDQYSRTRHSYRQWFGEHAPVDLWPPAAVRFGRDTRWVRVNLDDVHLVPRARPAPRRARSRLLRVVAFCAAAAAGGSVAAQDPRPDSLVAAGGDPFALSAAAFLQFYAVACLVVVAWSVWIGRRRMVAALARREEPGRPADAYEEALLCGGRPRALQVAITELVDRGHARIANGDVVTETKPDGSVAPLARALWERADRGVLRRRDWFGRTGELTEHLQDRERALQAKGLLPAPEAIARWPMWFGVAVVLGLAVPRMIAAEVAGRPYGYLALSAVAFLLLNGLLHVWAYRRHFRVTPAGREVAARLESSRSAAPLHAVAAAGTIALSTTPLADVHAYSQRKHASGGTACGGGNCGGGGGGCGGGGCGGCGG